MPPFSRGLRHLSSRLLARPSSSSRRLPSTKGPPYKGPLSWRPIRERTASLGAASPAKINSRRISPLYLLALLRKNIAKAYRIFTKSIRRRYRRLPPFALKTISFVSRLGFFLALILPPLTVVRNHFYDIIQVTGPSMSPYLNTDFEDVPTDVHDITKSSDRILLDLYCPSRGLRRGMVVALRTPHDPEKWAVKRIVALQGDRVFPLPHYPGYAALSGNGLIVPFGHVWVEGDVSDSSKKDVSLDSNIYGPISIGLITGKATYIVPSLFGRWIRVNSQHFRLPKRIQVNAVKLDHPDEEYYTVEFEKLFQNGKAAELLQFLKDTLREAGDVEAYRNDTAVMHFLHVTRRHANLQLQKIQGTLDDNGQVRDVAVGLLDFAHNVIGEEGQEDDLEDHMGDGSTETRSGMKQP